MGIYTPIGNYDLNYYLTNKLSSAWRSVKQSTVLEDDGSVTLAWVSNSTFTPNKTMRIMGTDLVIEENRIISGTITSMEFWVYDYEYYAGQITDMNVDGATFQGHINDMLQGSANGFLTAVRSEANIVVGTADGQNYEHNYLYPATDINLMGGNDSYTHAPIFEPAPSLTIDGGYGDDDRFYVGYRGGLTVVDFENNFFIDQGGNVHTIINFEFAQGSGGSDELYGALERSNRLSGGSGNDLIVGGNADDILYGGGGSDTIDGLSGDDTIYGGPNPDMMDGGDGVDTLSYDRYTFLGVTVSLLTGETDGSLARGDTFVNFENLEGTSARDTLSGDNGNNVVSGLGNDDIIFGHAGDDTLLGGAGDDMLEGGAGADAYYGGEGVDTASYAKAGARVVVDLLELLQTRGDAVGDTFTSIEIIEGSHWGDQLRGDGGADEFLGGLRSDRLYGRAGDDTLNGEEGADAIYGNSGADVLSGGDDTARDRFIFFTLADSGVGEGNRDVITDFTSLEDRIEISRFDADVSVAGNQAFNFIGSATFSSTAGELRYQHDATNNWTLVSVDVNGDAVANWEIQLTGIHSLVGADYLL